MMPITRLIPRLLAISSALFGLWNASPIAAEAISFPPAAEHVAAAPIQAAGAAAAAAPIGNFAGTMSSRNFASFPATIAITQDANGNLRGAAVLSSSCIKEGRLVIRLSGTNNITLAGSDTDGDNITFRGTIESDGSQMNLKYIVNGSASGRCETDEGSGILTKR